MVSLNEIWTLGCSIRLVISLLSYFPDQIGADDTTKRHNMPSDIFRASFIEQSTRRNLNRPACHTNGYFITADISVLPERLRRQNSVFNVIPRVIAYSLIIRKKGYTRKPVGLVCLAANGLLHNFDMLRKVRSSQLGKPGSQNQTESILYISKYHIWLR